VDAGGTHQSSHDGAERWNYQKRIRLAGRRSNSVAHVIALDDSPRCTKRAQKACVNTNTAKHISEMRRSATTMGKIRAAGACVAIRPRTERRGPRGFRPHRVVVNAADNDGLVFLRIEEE